MPVKNSPTESTEQTIKPEETAAVTQEQLQALLQQQSLLMEELRVLKADKAAPQAEPQAVQVINEVFVKARKPKKIKYKISAYEPEDAVINGLVVPGKKIMGDFKYTSDIAYINDEYRTGFELDKLNIHNDLTEEQLTNYQKDVREARQYIENVKNVNLDSQNGKFWKTREFKVDNLSVVYDTDSVENLINYYNILGGAFPHIGRNQEDAEARQLLLYLDVTGQEAKSKTSLSNARTSAYAYLQKVKDTWKKKDVLYFFYALNTKKDHGYSFETHVETLIDELAQFIEGEDTNIDKKRRPQMFIDAYNRMLSATDSDRIKAEGLVRAGLYYGLVRENKDRAFELRSNNHFMGSTIKEAAEFLIRPSNEDDFAYLSANVTQKWTD